MDDSLVYRSILTCKPQLVLALSLSDIQSVTDSLEAKELITPDVILRSSDRKAQARQLVEHILDRVKLDPACYGRFEQVIIEIIDVNVGQLIIHMLQTSYSKK